MSSHASPEPIAVIGMAFRFPQGAETPDEFWRMLADQTCASTPFPKDRFNIDAFWSPDGKKQSAIRTRHAHFLRGDLKDFDAGFFSMAPHEVGSMDPQHRGLMETTYHAFENAGLSMATVAGSRTSVHVGCFTSDFANMQFRDSQTIPRYNALGSAGSILANRISWFYDLHGASMYVDTACSSGLVAMALGCQGLMSGAADMAVVSASNLILGPEFNISLSNMNFLSPTGRCRSFDAQGDGYARGEGFATLILKPLSSAIAHGNPIRALVRSIGMNQDGHTSGGITQPSKDLQVQLIRETYRQAGLDMQHTRFFEAHGTGTAVGDPIEARAIGEAFLGYRSHEDPMYIGAVKSNIGHLEGSSGLAGVVKAILALERRQIPPNANFETLNPRIDDQFFHLKFPTSCVPWPTSDIRRASVNSFGFGGSNAHLVLDAADDYLQSIGIRLNHRALSMYRPTNTNTNGSQREVSRTIEGNGLLNPPEIHANGHTSNHTNGHANGHANGHVNGHANGRANGHAGGFANGCANGHTNEDPDGYLNRNAGSTNGYAYENTGGHENGHVKVSNISALDPYIGATISPRLVILSASDEGGISRYVQVLSDYFANSSDHDDRELLDDVVYTLNTHRSMLGWKSFGVLGSFSDFAGSAQLMSKPATDEIAAHAEHSRVHNPEFSQTISTALQIALVDWVTLFGVKPSVVVGHSSGEIAAAYCASFLCHESAIKVSYFRGLLARKLAKETRQAQYGMMSIGLTASQLSVELSELELQHPQTFASSPITISCVNSPSNVTVAGPVGPLGLLGQHLSDRNIFARQLKVDVGYHSPQMQLVASEYQRLLSDLQPGPTPNSVRMVSSATPGLVTEKTVCNSAYWVGNMISPVQFVDAMKLCCPSDGTNSVARKLDRSHLREINTHGWLEIGPHSALQGPLRETCKSQNRGDMFYTSLLVRNKPADRTVLEAMGNLFCHGFEVNVARLGQRSTDPYRRPQVILDLPQYPFNHSAAYWEESTRSREFRLRAHGEHPLLGCPAMDWNPLDARWRFIIRKDEMPWIADHVVSGKMMYPAAGMLVMAIEALKSLLPPEPFDLELRDVSFTAPIILHDGPEGTETQLSMTPTSKTRGKDAAYQFRIFHRKDDNWEEVCDGTIASRSPSRTQGVDHQKEAEFNRESAELAHIKAMKSCQYSIDALEMYEKVAETMKLVYGPIFQPLADIRYDREGGACTRILPFPDTNAFADVFRPVTIHPSTLDGIFQMGIPALSRGMEEWLPTLVPARLTRLWISNVGAGHKELGPEVAHVQTKFHSKRHAVGSTTVLSETDMQIRVEVEELEVTEIARDDVAAESDRTEKAICHEIHWKVDWTFLSPAELFEYCLQSRSQGPEPEQWYEELRRTLLSFAGYALDEMRAQGQEPLPSMASYVSWLHARLDLDPTSGPPSLSGLGRYHPDELLHMAENLACNSRRGAVNVLVGRHLKEILLGQIDPLQLLFDDPLLLPDFYQELNSSSKALEMLATYLDLIVHKDPGMRFLEIGAGTGATTAAVLQTIAHSKGGPRYSEYLFTDVSASFLATAKERFGAYDRLQYDILDIEADLEGQDIERGRHDVVVAANVLHATRDLRRTLSNVRALLKPGGQLILIEGTTPQNIETGFIFGTLRGWWLGSEEFRQESAVVSEAKWAALLQQEGFSGIDQTFRDWDSDICHGWSIMISTASPIEPQADVASSGSRFSEATLIVDENSHLQIETARNIQQQWMRSERVPEIITMSDAACLTGFDTRDLILLMGLEKPLLHDVETATFQWYQRIFTTSNSVLLIQGHDPESTSGPYWAMLDGLCRVCRNENPLVSITTLTLETTTCMAAARTASLTMKILHAMIDPLATDSCEPEYFETSGYLGVPRLSQAKHLDRHLATRTQQPVQPRALGSGPPVKLNIRVPGLLDSLEWVEDELADAPLAPDEVEVRVQAIGVNFKECLTLLGRVHSDSLGSECSGYVHRIGEGVTRLQVGDRVALASLETYRTLVRAREFQIVKLPITMSFTDAAAIPTAFCTAYHCLYHVARLQRHETILIHAAAGGTGQAAVQLAQHIGAEVFATVGSAGKKTLLIERYGIPASHIFYSRNASFADGVKRMTGGRGVDVVLNSLSGPLLVASWEIIAEFGRFIEIGRKDIDTRGSLPMFPFIKNAIFAGVDLAAIVADTRHRSRYVLSEVFHLVETGVIRPPYPVQPYPIEKAEEAFRLLQSGRSTGKIVLQIHDESVVPVQAGRDSHYRFAANATYAVAGGLGGIGRQIVRWMVRRGARNILLLSRSGFEGHKEKSHMIRDLHAQGVNLQHRACDIANAASVRDAVHHATETMPLIKGCFQAAMVLHDRPFGTMTHQEWCDSVAPKVQGSWNLHSALPSGMDFFVMLSSVVGILGNPGQSNYAAGNTFQDALARHRVAHGEKAVAVDLGMILGEGFVAERKDIQARLRRLDLLVPLTQPEIFAVFDYYCDPSVRFASTAPSQVVTGIQLPAILRQSNRDVPEALCRPIFRAVHQICPAEDVSVGGSTTTRDMASVLRACHTLPEAAEAIADALKCKMCTILGVDPDNKTIQDRMDAFEVDSLIALELRNWLAKEVRADVAVYEILGDVKLIDVGFITARKSQLYKAE